MWATMRRPPRLAGRGDGEAHERATEAVPPRTGEDGEAIALPEPVAVERVQADGAAGDPVPEARAP